MKKLDPHLTILWILGIIAVIYFTGEFYNYNESWNKIHRQGKTPTLLSGDNIASRSQDPFWKTVNEQGIVSNNYWNPYMFGGMAEVFSGVQHVAAVAIMIITGLSLNGWHSWFYIFDVSFVVIILWLNLPKAVTPEQITTNRENNKALNWLFLLIAGWLVFYWFYAEASKNY